MKKIPFLYPWVVKDEKRVKEVRARKPGVIVFYKSNYGIPPDRWTTIINQLWYYVAEEDRLWAKVIYYPLHWLEQRKFDFICLIGKHFPDEDGECERCYKKLAHSKGDKV